MPYSHWFSFVDLNYTFVLPYAYTHHHHHDPAAPNYQNYTHRGMNLGTNLEPNSDRFHLKLKFRPLYGLDVNLSNTFIRHANTTESINDIVMLQDYVSKQYTTDGSSFNYAAVTQPNGNYDSESKKRAFLYTTPFMRQQTIQYINQLALDVSCHLPIIKSGGYMLFKFGYVFEANINPGVGQNIYKATQKGWYGKKLNEIVDKDGNTGEAAIRKEAAEQLADWRRKAIGKQFNHYIRLSAEFAY